MPFNASKYSDDVQKVSKDIPLEEVLYLLKRDGRVFVKTLISEQDIDQAIDDVKERLDSDVEWDGSFFPGNSPNNTRQNQPKKRNQANESNSTNTKSSFTHCSKRNIHQDAADEPPIPASLRPLLDYAQLLLVGR